MIVHTLGVPRYIVWGYPGTCSGDTPVRTLELPSYVLGGYAGTYSRGTRVCRLGILGSSFARVYILLEYPGTFSGGTPVHPLAVPGTHSGRTWVHADTPGVNGYILWGYPGISSGDPRVLYLAVYPGTRTGGTQYTPWRHSSTL